MQHKAFLSLLLTSFSILLFAQSATTSEFETFANGQDKLLMQAYEKRDTVTYNKLLKEFLLKYDLLSSSDKKNYSRYYSNNYYNLACTYSLLNNKQAALDCLKKAINAGYYNYAHMMEDTDLDNIRNEQKFKLLMKPLKEIGDYMYILKKASKYNYSDTRPFPKFTYQSGNNPNLATLRKEFNLDSIAGSGNETSQILNLLHWIHYLIPHDGNHDNPTVKNALNMIAMCKKENRGLNCRGLATVLNECYLALGFKSRFVTCLPKDSLNIDPDCHVINAVYSNTYKKWLWIDPTNDAYVMNENGDLLSIEEVRDRIIHDKPLILNPEANWNRKFSKTKQNYLYSYMAKNLYMLQCNASSEYDEETFGNNKVITSITLLPLDYFMQTPNRSEFENKKANTTFIRYKTNNPTLFWQAP